jgi:hypothetical protein
MKLLEIARVDSRHGECITGAPAREYRPSFHKAPETAEKMRSMSLHSYMVKKGTRH